VYGYITPTIEMLPLTKLNIKKVKLEDIQKQQKFIPDVYHGFYRNLASASARSLEDQTSCSEEEDVEVSAVASTESFKTSLNGLKWLVRSWR